MVIILHSIWKNLHRAEKIYTGATCGACNKYQVWVMMMMMIKRRSVEIASLSSRRKQEGASSLEGGGEVGRAPRESGNLQPVLLLASLDKSILQIRWGDKDEGGGQNLMLCHL